MAPAASAAACHCPPIQQVRRWRTLPLPLPLPLPLLLLLLSSLTWSLGSAAAFSASPSAHSSASSSSPSFSSHDAAAPPAQGRGSATGNANGVVNSQRGSNSGSNNSVPPSRSSAANSRGRGGSDIVFPDSQFKPRFAGHRPNCAREGLPFCEDGVDGYPMVHLNQVLDNTIGYREYFGNDTIGQNIAERFGPDGETTICPSTEQIIFPKMGQNVDGQWVFIVNLEREYQQGVRVELCKNPDEPCLFSNALPSGVNAVCRQKYIYRRLVAVGEGGMAEPDSFRLPSCCACFINSEVTARILNPDKPGITKRRRRRSKNSQ